MAFRASKYFFWWFFFGYFDEMIPFLSVLSTYNLFLVSTFPIALVFILIRNLPQFSRAYIA